LLEVSGGVSEWTETVDDPQAPYSRAFVGTRAFGGSWEFRDRIDVIYGSSPRFRNGFRVAALVPTPSAMLVVLLVCGAFGSTRRRS
jgi:hypothetical protein